MTIGNFFWCQVIVHFYFSMEAILITFHYFFLHFSTATDSVKNADSLCCFQT